MKMFFEFDFKRAFFSKKTLISSLIVLTLLLIPYFSEIKFPHPGLDGINYFIRLGGFSYLPFIAPLLASIPFSNSYIIDKEKDVFSKLFTIIEPKVYFTSRLIVNALVSGFVFLITKTILLIFLIIAYGINNIHIDVTGTFSPIYNKSKIAYIIISLLITFVSAASFSTFILGISTLTKSKFLLILLPLFYVVVTAVILPNTCLVEQLNVMTLFQIDIYSKITGIGIILYDLILFSIGSFLFYCFGYKKMNKVI
ncbi:hypothetical protein LGL08_07185 [Clostridium estertheticum]|uniref:hypothetical protein n=1 Tax=Clostridium estertheticum TaxID=238834 RepID=UPI001CF2DF7C|nr:hypothetical protein [Clostridium estertheticum]MCB2306252.1 hypothetical protein [Clostridium estertheticum]MCB2344425.1 hypothetical protein [Clostridium estertheticum]MCB2349344.1 hypothetical protein [Clostridium estertheticum]WAG45088.1 hypothetical protein LL127_16260 [Clostridium estertheticum]